MASSLQPLWHQWQLSLSRKSSKLCRPTTPDSLSFPSTSAHNTHVDHTMHCISEQGPGEGGGGGVGDEGEAAGLKRKRGSASISHSGTKADQQD